MLISIQHNLHSERLPWARLACYSPWQNRITLMRSILLRMFLTYFLPAPVTHDPISTLPCAIVRIAHLLLNWATALMQLVIAQAVTAPFSMLCKKALELCHDPHQLPSYIHESVVCILFSVAAISLFCISSTKSTAYQPALVAKQHATFLVIHWRGWYRSENFVLFWVA